MSPYLLSFSEPLDTLYFVSVGKAVVKTNCTTNNYCKILHLAQITKYHD